MRIQFFLKDKETEIASFDNMSGNPYKVGDVISMQVRELSPNELSQYNSKFQERFSERNMEQSEMFHLKKIKLVGESKFFTIKTLDESEAIIEYYCEIIED